MVLMFHYICDVAIHPDYQGFGIGKQIVNKLVEFSDGYNKIILLQVWGKSLLCKIRL